MAVSAIAAYGPFVFAGILGSVIGATGSAVAFFWGLAVFFALNTALNWWFTHDAAPHTPADRAWAHPLHRSQPPRPPAASRC